MDHPCVLTAPVNMGSDRLMKTILEIPELLKRPPLPRGSRFCLVNSFWR